MKHIFEVASVLALAVFVVGCRWVTGVGSVVNSAVDYQQRSLIVGTLNVENKTERERDTATRMRTYSRRYAAMVSDWGVVGLQELRYTKRLVLPDSYYVLSPDQITCADGSSGYGGDCFGRGIGTSNSVVMYRGLGIVSNNQFWEVVPNSTAQTQIGSFYVSLIYRSVVGARFKNKKSGDIVPIYTVHISNTDNHSRQYEESRDLVTFIRASQQPGDLPPVVIGDFNCESWDVAARTTLLQYFDKASDVYSIDLVFVGEAQAFPSSGKEWQADAGTARRVDARGENPIDHLGTVVQLHTAQAGAGSAVGPSDPPGNHCP